MLAAITLTIDPIWMPILISVICAAIGFWPSRCKDPGAMGLGALFDAFNCSLRLGACVIIALISWVVYLALT